MTTSTTSATSSTNASSIVTTLGAGSGIDVKALATSLVDAERMPRKTAIEAKISKSEANISGYSAIKYVLDNLKTAFTDLKDQSDFSSIAPSNSQPSALSVVAGAKASTGTHTIVVSALAKPQRNISMGFATSSTPLNGGAALNLSLSVHGGAASTIAVTAENATPAGVVSTINKAGLGITAQLVNTGDATAPYKIVVTGTTGVANDFSLTSNNLPAAPTVTTTAGDANTTESSLVDFGAGLTAGQSMTVGGLTYTAASDTTATQLAAAFASLASGATSGAGTTGSYSGTLTGFSTGAVAGNTVTATSSTANTDVANLTTAVGGLGFATSLQTAANAALNVDGIAITASSNQVTGAISGATLNLTALTSGTGATLDFARDPSSVKTKLQALVTAYNDANSMLNVVSDPKSEVETYGATLVGNSVVGQIRSQIRSMVQGNSSSASGGVSGLRDLGISIDKEGVLQLDATKLDTALTNNFDHAVTMLSANQENLSIYSTSSAGVAGDSVKKLTALLATSGTLTAQNLNATSKISAYKLELEKLETRMAGLLERYSKQFAAMDSIVGQANSLRTSLTSTFDGMMAAYTNK